MAVLAALVTSYDDERCRDQMSSNNCVAINVPPQFRRVGRTMYASVSSCKAPPPQPTTDITKTHVTRRHQTSDERSRMPFAFPPRGTHLDVLGANAIEHVGYGRYRAQPAVQLQHENLDLGIAWARGLRTRQNGKRLPNALTRRKLSRGAINSVNSGGGSGKLNGRQLSKGLTRHDHQFIARHDLCGDTNTISRHTQSTITIEKQLMATYKDGTTQLRRSIPHRSTQQSEERLKREHNTRRFAATR